MNGAPPAATGDTKSIEFVAVVKSVQTLAEAALRVTFDMPDQFIPQAADLMHCKSKSTMIRVVITYEPE